MALCISNTPIPGIQKHLCWPIGYRGMGVWGAIPEPKQFFWHCAVQTPPFLGIQNTFAGLWGAVVSVFGAPPQIPNNIFGIVHFNHHHRRYPKTPLLAYGVPWYGCLERHPRTQTTFFRIVHFKRPNPRYPKTPLLACRVQGYGCLGRHPRTQTIFLALCISNTPILGIQKHVCWRVGYSGMGVWGATPKPK